ncbi:MAG TPA: VOC family protein [Myxococcota bacterium]|nr:VOC family protein [Myxococcota bacterium]
MTATKLDHIALGLPRASDAIELFEERLGGAPAGGYDGSAEFGFRQWEFQGGGRLEVIYPSGPPNGFMHRFLAAGGPRVHHVTLKVASLDETLAKAAAHGQQVIGVERSNPHWQEAFLHPKQAQGIVVQMVEQAPGGEGDDLLPASRPRADGARLVGLRLFARSAEAARRQWSELLGGSAAMQGSSLVFRWEQSPLVLLVDVRPDAAEGPQQIELRATRDLILPRGPYPGLGTRFVQTGR